MIDKWIFKIAIKKITAALAGYGTGIIIALVAGNHLQSILNQLSIIGLDITISIREEVFRPAMAAIGIGGFAGIHDWLKLRFPNSKYL